MGVPHFRTRSERLTEHSLGQADLHFEVTSFFEGSRTEVRVALVGENEEEFYGEGIAYCHPRDAYDRALGQHIAFLRAAGAALEDAYLAAIEETEKRAKNARGGRNAGGSSEPKDRGYCLDPDCNQCEVIYGVVGFGGTRSHDPAAVA